MLFDSEDKNNEEKQIDEIDSIESTIIKIDKIFNNSYNTGCIDFEQYDTPRVDIQHVEKYSDSYNFLEYHRMKNLERAVDLYFRESEYSDILEHRQRIPKQTIPFLYEAIRSKFIDYEYTNIEIFSSIAEYFNLRYKYLYENIPAIYKEELIKELDDKYNIFEKCKMKKLF